MTWSVQMIKVGASQVRGPEVFWMSDWDKWHTLHFLVALLRRDDMTVLVNTGPPRDLEAMNELWVSYLGDERATLRVMEEERLDRALARFGVRPDEVDMVIITPLQQYALGGVQTFTKARLCISRRGWAAFHAPRCKTSHAQRAAAVSDDMLNHLCCQAWDRMNLVEDDHELAPGLRVHWTGGHHPESMAVCVDTAAGRVVLADCIFHYENVENDHMLGITEDIEACRVAYEWIRREADIIVPLYDPRVCERHPNGLVVG